MQLKLQELQDLDLIYYTTMDLIKKNNFLFKNVISLKGVGKKLLKLAFHGIPMVGTVISWAATIAKYLAYIAIIETLLAEAQGEEEPEQQPKEA